MALWAQPVPTRLKRYYGAQDLHFITCSCYHRLPMLGTARRRNWFLQILEEARRRRGKILSRKPRVLGSVLISN